MRKKAKGKAWVKVLTSILGIGILGGGGYLAYGHNQYVEVAGPGQVFVTADGSKVDLMGKTGDEIDQLVSAWWEEKKDTPVTFKQGKLLQKFDDADWQTLGVSVDEEGTLGKVKFSTYWEELSHKVNEPVVESQVEIEPVLSFGEPGGIGLAEFVEKHQPPLRKAEVHWSEGKVVRTYESQGMSFDESRLKAAIKAAVMSGEDLAIPVKEVDKKVPDKMLDKISTVVSEFKTTFNGGKISRSANIRLAADTIDGLVLMPGEQFSFNDYLGRRTIAKGYKTAGVYVSGRHDFDVGGGICQVSTTLYNALLMGEMSADVRFPHSLPVPYVPLGRDAAVSYPQPDFKFTNQRDVPIAISAETTKGSITFRILGPEKHSREVKFESRLIKSWSHGEKVVDDPSLKPGTRKVVDKGGAGRQVRTWKVIYENGKEVKRVDLGVSTYRGGPRIVAANKREPEPEEQLLPGAPVGDGGVGIPASVPGDGLRE